MEFEIGRFWAEPFGLNALGVEPVDDGLAAAAEARRS
jgi:hypothetical protein